MFTVGSKWYFKNVSVIVGAQSKTWGTGRRSLILNGALVTVSCVVVVVVGRRARAARGRRRAGRARHHPRVHAAEHAAAVGARALPVRAQPLGHGSLVVVRDLVHSVYGACNYRVAAGVVR